MFFIPCFMWNRRYFVRTSCCNRTYELSFEKGDAIRRGDDSDSFAVFDWMKGELEKVKG